MLLAVIVTVGVALRIVYVLAVAQHDHHLYDATYYELQAETIVNGDGFFTDPFVGFNPNIKAQPAADHPPLTVITFLPAATLTSSYASNLAMRFTTVLFGAAALVLIGLLGRRVAGPLAGVIAAGIAAIDPILWVNDGLVMSESLATLLIVGVLVVGYRVLQLGCTWPRVAGLGVLAALAALTRAELAMIVPLFVLPVLLVASGHDWRTRGRTVAGAVLVFVLFLTPWCAYNLSRFDEPVFISTGGGLALRNANCPTTYYGSHIGWSEVFPPCTPSRPEGDQSVWDRDNMRAGLHYMSGHLARLPVVVAARLGRIWNVFKISQAAEPATSEGRPSWGVWLGAVTTWLMVPLAVIGAILLRRRGDRIWPLVTPIVGFSLTVALIAGGLVRYRAPVEPAVVVLVSVALASWIGARADRAAPTTSRGSALRR
jgi:4-amino-4-deoxy-L-arabinose transferase-like glycosyltransferase